MPVLRLMDACGTQWRMDFGRPTGLDYNAMYRVARTLRIRVDEKILRGIMILEELSMKRAQTD